MYDRKKREISNNLDILEYIAMLVSFNPKATKKAIDSRRKEEKRQENSQKQDVNKVNERGENPYGQHVNTSFFDTIKKFGGEQAIKDLQTITGDNGTQEVNAEEDNFIEMAKKMALENEKDLKEEAEYKIKQIKKMEQLKNQDDIIF